MACKTNCWEIKQCGRGPGGARSGEHGICRAAIDTDLNGYNQGVDGGRMCWAVVGTMCGGEVQGSNAQMRMSCLTCEVYEQVRAEEGSAFVLLPPWYVSSA